MEPSARACIAALIQIPEVSVTGDPIQSPAVLIVVEVQGRVGPCATCGAITRALPPDIDRTVRHLPVAGQPCDLIFPAYQLLCRPCRHTWVGPLDLVSPHPWYTKAYAPEVVAQCREQSWPRVSIWEPLGSDAVQGISTRVRQPQLATRAGVAGRVLGLDEIAQHQGQRDCVCVLSDIERGQGIEVLRSRTNAALEAYCAGRLPRQRAAMAVVSIDRWAAEADVARTKVPQAAIVVDRLHVLKHRPAKVPDARRTAPHPLPKTTRDERKGWRWLLVRNDAELNAQDRPKRQRAFAIWPELATRHARKEECRGCYARQNRRTALRALETWIAQVQQTGHKALLKFVATVRHWEQEILTSFEERSTNGFVEGTHNKIKLIKRRAFGFRNGENFRYRILHECGGL
jgi:transposase